MQETCARWYSMTRQQQREIQSPGAWLRKVTGRVCLDLLGSVRNRVRWPNHCGEEDGNS